MEGYVWENDRRRTTALYHAYTVWQLSLLSHFSHPLPDKICSSFLISLLHSAFFLNNVQTAVLFHQMSSNILEQRENQTKLSRGSLERYLQKEETRLRTCYDWKKAFGIFNISIQEFLKRF